MNPGLAQVLFCLITIDPCACLFCGCVMMEALSWLLAGFLQCSPLERKLWRQALHSSRFAERPSSCWGWSV